MREPVRAGRVCALILAGGRSSRMGQDKVLLTLDGETLLERAAAFWRSTGAVNAVLAAVGTEDHVPDLPAGVIPVRDLYPGCGPLAGIHAAFAATDAEYLYVSAVDMPYLRRDALLPLPAGDAAAYTMDGRPEPLFAVYRRTALPAVEEALAQGRRKLSDLLRSLDTEFTELPAEFRPMMRNLNTPDDVLRALAGTPPTVVFAGWSGAGKTTFIEKLLPELTARGVRVSVIKHDAHGFQMDKPGKDTWRFSHAGAAAVAISGPNGWAVLSAEPADMEDLRQKLPPADLILVEGHKESSYPRVLVHRKENGKPLPLAGGPLAAVITDEALPDLACPRLGPEDAAACAELLIRIFLPEKGNVHEP